MESQYSQNSSRKVWVVCAPPALPLTRIFLRAIKWNGSRTGSYSNAMNAYAPSLNSRIMMEFELKYYDNLMFSIAALS